MVHPTRILSVVTRWLVVLLLLATLFGSAPPAQAAYPLFAEVTGAGNPFDGVDVGVQSVRTLGDVDGDGDLDAFVGEADGSINYYRNDGTAVAPAFTEVTGGGNPFDGVDVGSYSTPTLGDVDGDGDLDAFVGEDDGNINYYRNDGTAIAPSFTALTGAGNPFNGVDVGTYSVPTLGDVDGDGDLDAFIGEYDGVINYYRNDGTAVAPSFTQGTGSGNPLTGVDVGYWSTPTLGDVDGDGDLDAFVGEFDGNINYYRNVGTAVAPSFTQGTGGGNPLTGVDVGDLSTPVLADVDGDGDLDAFVGENGGNINYYRNGAMASAPAYSSVTGSGNPFDGVDVGDYSNLCLRDADGDGDLDAFVGELYGAIRYYRNDGTAVAPWFTAVTGAGNPFDGVGAVGYIVLTLGDVDGDGDLDALAGEQHGFVHYYRNDGTAVAPNFIEITGVGNPFDGVDVGRWSAPSLGDVDGDGDLDAFIGEEDGVINYYRNTGSEIAPIFTPVTGAGNPFDGVDVGGYSAPCLGDVDGDGDLDAFVGENNGSINYYRNDGTAAAPSFTAVTGAGNPLNGVDVGLDSAPALGDVDGDGDLDAFAGNREGIVNFYRANTRPTSADRAVTALEDAFYIFGLDTFPYCDAETDAWDHLRIDSAPLTGTLFVDADTDSQIDAGEILSAGSTVASGAVQYGLLKYQSASNGSGSPYTAFAFTMHDGANYSAYNNTVTIDVTPVNDAPVITGSLSLLLDEGATGPITTMQLTEADPDDGGLGLTYTVSSGLAHGRVELSSAPGVTATAFTQQDIEDGLLRYAHDGSESVSDYFGVQLADGGEDGAQPDAGTFDVTITPVNDPPVLRDDQAAVTQGGWTYGDLLANDSDPDNELRVDTTPVSGPFHGALTLLDDTGSADIASAYGDLFALSANGVFIYTHDGEGMETDYFVYQACEVGAPGLCATATVTITVGAAADLEVSKRAEPPSGIVPGRDVLTYTVTVTNAGPSDVVGAVLSDTLPSGLLAPVWTCAGANCPAASGAGSLSETLQLPVGGVVTFSISGQVSASATSLYNAAEVANPTVETDPTDNRAEVDPSLSPLADLSIAKDGEGGGAVGAPVTYTIVVSNVGPSAVVGATVDDDVPAEVVGPVWQCQTAGGGSCGSGSGDIVAHAVDLGAGETVTYTITGAAGTTQAILNTAVVSAPVGVADPVMDNNQAAGYNTNRHYLPVLFKSYADALDLVVTGLSATTNEVRVTIQNVGNAPIVDDFWVDVSFNPRVQPPGANQPWPTIASHGVTWGVTRGLAAGESLELVTGGDYYFGPPDSSAPPFPVGASVWAYVDSVNFATTYGAVQESNEENNTRSAVSSAATTDFIPGPPPQRRGEMGNLPPR